MRASFVAFVLFAVSAVPSLGAPIGDVEERALPAIIPGIVGSVVGGLSHKNNKRIACGGATGFPCPNDPFAIISARGVDREERSIWSLPPQIGEVEPSLPKQMYDSKRNAGVQPLPCPVDQPDCEKLYGIFPITEHPLDTISRRDVNNKRKACLPNEVNCPEPYRPNLFGLPEKSILKRSESLHDFLDRIRGPVAEGPVRESSDEMDMQSKKRTVILHPGLGKPVFMGIGKPIFSDMGADSSVLDNPGSDDESDNSDSSQRRSFQTVGPNDVISKYFASHPDAIKGSDSDDQRRSLPATIDKVVDSSSIGLSPSFSDNDNQRRVFTGPGKYLRPEQAFPGDHGPGLAIPPTTTPDHGPGPAIPPTTTSESDTAATDATATATDNSRRNLFGGISLGPIRLNEGTFGSGIGPVIEPTTTATFATATGN